MIQADSSNTPDDEQASDGQEDDASEVREAPTAVQKTPVSTPTSGAKNYTLENSFDSCRIIHDITGNSLERKT